MESHDLPGVSSIDTLKDASFKVSSGFTGWKFHVCKKSLELYNTLIRKGTKEKNNEPEGS